MLLQVPPIPNSKACPLDHLENSVQYVIHQLEKIRGIQVGKRPLAQEDDYYPWNLEDVVEKDWCIDWLRSVVKISIKRLDNISMGLESDEFEKRFDKLIANSSRAIAELSGKAASNALSVWLNLWDEKAEESHVIIKEPDFSQADVGSKTWGSSILLSRWISRNEFDASKYSNLLELGSGTGLCSLAISQVLSKSKNSHTLTTTDYLDSILDSVKESFLLTFEDDQILWNSNTIELRSNLNVKISKCDWFSINSVFASDKYIIDTQLHCNCNKEQYESNMVEPPKANYYDVSSNIETFKKTPDYPEFNWEKSVESYDLIIASDVLYEVEHALIIPRIINYLLAKSSSSSLKSLYNAEAEVSHKKLQEIIDSYQCPMFVIVAPLRKTHWNEVNTFESEMKKLGFEPIYQKDTTLSQDIEEWCMRISAEKLVNTAKLDSMLSTNSDDEEMYRIYFWIKS